jgi:hypothetical protein
VVHKEVSSYVVVGGGIHLCFDSNPQEGRSNVIGYWEFVSKTFLDYGMRWICEIMSRTYTRSHRIEGGCWGDSRMLVKLWIIQLGLVLWVITIYDMVIKPENLR